MKHKDKETQQRREAKQETKKQTFCCSCRFGLLASLWAKSCQGERAKNHYETRVFVVFLFVGVLLGKLTKRTITRTKLRRQDNKTTRQQKIQEQNVFFSFFFHSLSLFSFFCCFAVRRKRRKKKENKMSEKKDR